MGIRRFITDIIYFQKGCGYHLDMLVVGLMVGVCSLLGLPWCVAATVLCLGHVDSLKVWGVES